MNVMKTVLGVLLLGLTTLTFAADEDGKFAAKGAGRKSCEAYLMAKDNAQLSAQKPTGENAKEHSLNDFRLYAGWLEGYITAYNQFQSGNYDITPWQTTELLMVLLARHCKDNPETRILSATNGLIQALFPARLQAESQVMEVTLLQHKSYYYTEIIFQVKKRLTQLGLYSGDVTQSTYATPEIQAMRAFQKKHGLPETGVPDQRSLTHLFLRMKAPS